MYKIKYFKQEIIGEETKYNIETYTDYEIVENEQGEPELIEVQKERKVPYTEYRYEIKQKEYETTDEKFEYWLDIIQKTYGKYGEVTSEDIPDIKTKEEIQLEVNAKLLKDSASLQIELEKQKQINATLLLQIAQLGGN